jgi:hypothetical protein
VVVPDEEDEPVEETVGRGARVSEPEPVWLTEGRRVTVTQEVDDAERVWGREPDGEAVPVSVTETFGVAVMLREMGGVALAALQRLGEGDAEGVLESAGLFVGLELVFREEERAGDFEPVLEKAVVRLDVPDAVGVLETELLRVPVEDTVDVFD